MHRYTALKCLIQCGFALPKSKAGRLQIKDMPFNLTLRDEDCQLNKSSSLRNAPQEPTIQN
jgi:hypothetical protein